jgi:hypothetical protein
MILTDLTPYVFHHLFYVLKIVLLLIVIVDPVGSFLCLLD